MSPDPEAAAVLDRYAAATGRPVNRMRVGRLAACTRAGQALLAEAARRGITIELIGTELS